jgi:hypothetical protein
MEEVEEPVRAPTPTQQVLQVVHRVRVARQRDAGGKCHLMQGGGLHRRTRVGGPDGKQRRGVNQLSTESVGQRRSKMIGKTVEGGQARARAPLGA